MKKVALDDADRVILGELRENGRASYTQLGALAGLSPHAVAPRVRRLLDIGVITRFTALLDHRAVGRGLEALIDIRLLSTADPDDFEAAVAKLPAAVELSFLTGRFDYILRTACRDADDLDQTVRALRRAGAAATETRMLMRTNVYIQPVR